MESSSSQCLKQFEVSYKCDQCEKEYKRKSSLTRHFLTNHQPIELLKLKLKNENLLLQMELFTDQIKLLKKLILIQEHTLRTHGRSGPSGITNLNNRLPGM
mgnify:CR=1 FL=1